MARILFSICLVTCLAACDSGGIELRNETDATLDVATADPGLEAETAADTAEATAPDVAEIAEPGAEVEVATPDTAEAVDDDAPDVFVPDVTDAVQAFPPRSLPFEYTRAPDGIPMSAAEVTAFTKKVTGLWKKIDWFRWVLRTNFGVDPSTGKADFLAWHGDFNAEKAGDTITFHENGGDDNMWIPGSVVLSSAINGYLLTGDWTMGKVAEQFCKGLTGVVTGFVWDANDPAPYLMARTIFPMMEQQFTLDAATWKDDGRKKAVKYGPYGVSEDWNAKTYHFPNNPTWGDVWVRTMRSKDDVRAITRMIPFLYYLVTDAKDAFVKTACQETLTTMTAFAKDTVDYDYNMRTKGKDGVAYVIPCSGTEGAQDLGSYMCYYDLDPRDECDARLATDMIAYGVQKTNDCGSGFGSTYDGFACVTHYYNYPIVWDYHMAAVGNTLVQQKNLTAWYLLDGLGQRIDSYMHPSADEPGQKDSAWNKDRALLLVEAASVGLPLTWSEAAFVQKHWTQAIVDFQDWPNWDLWSATVPDGAVKVRPDASNDGVDIENLTMLLEYCNSPFKNPAGAPFVDCAVVKDIANWGK